MNIRTAVGAAAVGVVVLGLIACTAPPSADVVRLPWSPTTTTTTTSATSTTSTTTTSPPTSEPTTAAPPAPEPRHVDAMPVPASRLSWACRYETGRDGDARRHAAFVRNVAGSGLPDSSRRQVLAQLSSIEAGMDLYCTAERLTGVPALVLAALHYREANNDPARSIMSGEPLGEMNPDTHTVEGTTPLDNAISAAEHLRSGAVQIYGVVVSRQMNSIELAYAAAAYNRGGRYCRADQLH